jgi:hypothetical protein
MKCVGEKREHVNYLKEVKFSKMRRREALRMAGPSRSQVQPKRQAAKALGSPVSRLLRNLFEWRVDTSDVVTLQSVDNWKNCAAQDNSESLPASSGCASQMHIRRQRMQNVVCCNHARMRSSAGKSTQLRRSQQCATVKATVGGFRTSGYP